MTRHKLFILGIVVGSISILLGLYKVAHGDPACWVKYGCSGSYQCTVWVDANDIEPACQDMDEGWYDADWGWGCAWLPGAGFDACLEEGEIVLRWDGQWECSVISWADPIHLGCCTAPCPTGTGTCQNF